MGVGRLVGQALGDDDLVRLIHRSLRVVALHVAIARLHDATVRVGEVALRLRIGFAVLARRHLVQRQGLGCGRRGRRRWTIVAVAVPVLGTMSRLDTGHLGNGSFDLLILLGFELPRFSLLPRLRLQLCLEGTDLLEPALGPTSVPTASEDPVASGELRPVRQPLLHHRRCR